MNKPQSPRRSRGRGPKRNNKGNGVGRSDNRAKGNPRQSLEKYKAMARDALQAGDRVLAEHYFQFADHYQRVCNERFGVSIDDDDDSDVDFIDQEDQQIQSQAQSQAQAQPQPQARSRRPQQRSRSQRAEDATAIERAERPRKTGQDKPIIAPVAEDENAGEAVDVPVQTSSRKATIARANGRARAANLEDDAPEGQKQAVDEAVSVASEEKAPKPRPRRRRKPVEEIVEATSE